MKKLYLLIFLLSLFSNAYAIEDKKVSIIIPAYNAEKYIDDCLNSVLNQTYNNLEIIVVDDCSTDNTYNMLKAYSQKDNRIKLYKMEKNGGVSRTRNKAMKHITGDYLYFIDADDWIDLNYIEEMVRAIEKYNADIIINKNIFIHNKKSKKRHNNILDKYNELNSAGFYGGWPYIWNNLIRTSFFRKVNAYFPENLKYEDIFFITQLFANSNDKYIINGPFYHYRKHNNSISAENKWMEIFDNVEIMKLLHAYLKENNLLSKAKICNIDSIISKLSIHKQQEKLYNMIRNFFIEIQDDIINNKVYNRRDLSIIQNIIKYESYEKFHRYYITHLLFLYSYCAIFCLVLLFGIAMAFKAIYLLINDLRNYLKTKSIK